ncbi:MAG TPA: aminotransferase class IV, partial [Rhodothermales bacterium]|nr:aminotransferase class IV [Rhodothermales bacterium]
VWLRQSAALVTPALDGRGLPGVMRAAVLDRGPSASEGPVTVDDLHTGGRLLLSNAVRGLWEVEVVQVD